MKFWMRIFITFLVIIVIGFAIWAFFFREKTEETAYNSATSFVDYKYSLNLSKDIEELKKLTYIKDDESLQIPSDTNEGKAILDIRRDCFSGDDIVKYVNGTEAYRYSSYETIENLTDEIIAEYIPYLKNNKAKIEYTNKLKSTKNEYVENLKKYKDSIQFVISTQKTIENNVIGYQTLQVQYEGLRDNYKKVLNSAGKFVLSMHNFINDSLYDENMKFDTITAMHNMFVRQLIVATEKGTKEEVDYFTSLNRIQKSILKTKANTNIYGDICEEYEFLLEFNDLNNKYSSALDIVCNSNLTDKNEMAKGNNLSSIIKEAQSGIVHLLNILNFGGEL